MSCGDQKSSQKRFDCDNCKCGESICTRELRDQLRKLIGKKISVFVKNESSLIIGNLLKVDCGTIFIQGTVQEDVTQRPILIKLCDITGFICGDFFNQPPSNRGSFPSTDQLDDCHQCSCPCIENDCVRDLREQLQDYIGKEMVISFLGQTVAGPLLKVNCGSVLIGDFLGTGFIFYVPLCKILFAYTLSNGSSDSNGHKEKRKCKCECVNDVCTIALREDLQKDLNTQVQIFLECFNPEPIIGTILKVNCGTVVVFDKNIAQALLIPLCNISTVVNVTGATPFIPGAPN